MLRFTYPIAFWLAVAVQCFAQEAQPRMSFLSAPVCGAAEADDQELGALSPREEIQRLLADLPRGRERDMALQLLKEVSEGRLQGFCRDPQGGEFVAASGSGAEAGSGKFRVALGNRSLPRVRADIAALPEGGGFGYAYRVSNGADAGRRSPLGG